MKKIVNVIYVFLFLLVGGTTVASEEVAFDLVEKNQIYEIRYYEPMLVAEVEYTGDNGGSIKILGNRIALEDNAKVSSSGANGGGEILIGGNYLGKGPEPNASATVILQGAEITADALNSGDGGRVIVWSDEYTNFAGLITAKGSDTGIGGFVETSSKDNLQAFLADVKKEIKKTRISDVNLANL